MNIKSILKKYGILMLLLCIFFVGCGDVDKIAFCNQFNFSYESDGVCFDGLTERIDGEVFYIPEKICGKRVVKFSDIYNNKNYPKIIIFSESVKYIEISFPYQFVPDEERLETLVILSTNFKSLSLEKMTSDNNFLHSIVFCSSVPPRIESDDVFKNDTLLFYVPDDCLTTYLTDYTWGNYASKIRPASEYPNDLSQFGISKKDLTYKESTDSYSWYYCDIPENEGLVCEHYYFGDAHNRNLYIILNKGNVFSNSYNILGMNDDELYFYLIYDGKTSVCELKTFLMLNTKPTVSNILESRFKRVFVYSNIPLNIFEYYYNKPESYSSLTKNFPKEYPGYEMIKIN